MIIESIIFSGAASFIGYLGYLNAVAKRKLSEDKLSQDQYNLEISREEDFKIKREKALLPKPVLSSQDFELKKLAFLEKKKAILLERETAIKNLDQYVYLTKITMGNIQLESLRSTQSTQNYIATIDIRLQNLADELK